MKRKLQVGFDIDLRVAVVDRREGLERDLAGYPYVHSDLHSAIISKYNRHSSLHIDNSGLDGENCHEKVLASSCDELNVCPAQQFISLVLKKTAVSPSAMIDTDEDSQQGDNSTAFGRKIIEHTDSSKVHYRGSKIVADLLDSFPSEKRAWS